MESVCRYVFEVAPLTTFEIINNGQNTEFTPDNALRRNSPTNQLTTRGNQSALDHDSEIVVGI